MTLAQQLKAMSLPGTPAYRAAEAMEAAEGALKGLYETGAPDGLALTADEIQARFDAARAALAKLRGEA